MSEHSETKNSVVGAVIMLLIIAALVTLGIGAMNSGATGPAAIAGALLFLFGLFAVLTLGKDR